MAAAGLSYYEVHDFEVPPDAVDEALRHARDHGLRCAQYAPSLFTDPDYRDGALTAPRAATRRNAVELRADRLLVRAGWGGFPLAKDAARRCGSRWTASTRSATPPVSATAWTRSASPSNPNPANPGATCS